MTGLLRQSVYARLAGYEDVNDHECLFRDPAMRAVIGRKALGENAAFFWISTKRANIRM